MCGMSGCVWTVGKHIRACPENGEILFEHLVGERGRGAVPASTNLGSLHPCKALRTPAFPTRAPPGFHPPSLQAAASLTEFSLDPSRLLLNGPEVSLVKQNQACAPGAELSALPISSDPGRERSQMNWCPALPMAVEDSDPWTSLCTPCRYTLNNVRQRSWDSQTGWVGAAPAYLLARGLSVFQPSGLCPAMTERIRLTHRTPEYAVAHRT